MKGPTLFDPFTQNLLPPLVTAYTTIIVIFYRYCAILYSYAQLNNKYIVFDQTISFDGGKVAYR